MTTDSETQDPLDQPAEQVPDGQEVGSTEQPATPLLQRHVRPWVVVLIFLLLIGAGAWHWLSSLSSYLLMTPGPVIELPAKVLSLIHI